MKVTPKIEEKAEKQEVNEDSKPEEQYQEKCKEIETSFLEDGAIVMWLPDFMSKNDSEELFKHLYDGFEWFQSDMPMYGKIVKTPRLQCVMATEGSKPSLYSKRAPLKWDPAVDKIREKIEKTLKMSKSFDYVLMNLYRDGNDYISWHRDREAEGEGKNIIASLSLGATRKFILKHSTKEVEKTFFLTSGSLIVMAGETQKSWKHTVPKEKKVTTPRINLTFRLS